MSMTRRDWHDDREDGINWCKRDLEASIAGDARPCGAGYDAIIAAGYRAQEETRQREAREQAARIADGEFFEINALTPMAREMMWWDLRRRCDERNADRARREQDEREAKREDARLARGEQARLKRDR